jgi:RNA polymerase sigma-70 factor (ECF subfamily)
LNDQLSTEQAIEELFSLYGNDVYRFALYTLHNEEESMDVVQETFYRAFKAWGNFRRDSSPKTWLLHIARNYMVDLLRKKRTEQARQAALFQNSNVSVNLDSLIEVTDLVARLPEHYRQVMILRFVEDLTVEQTAQALGWSPTKVRMTQHRAIKRLREFLAADVGKGGIPSEG